jgi:L-ascorbate metabolism protein UlaG (beta-lactamase superfamily)
MITVKSDQIIDSILVQTTQSSSNILPKWILSSYSQHTHTPRTPREKRIHITIYLITHTHTHTSSSEIAFVVLRLHCQIKVVPEGTSLILSKSGIEHAEETFRRARVWGVCQQRSQHKRQVRKRSKVAPPPLRQRKRVLPLCIFSLV